MKPRIHLFFLLLIFSSCVSNKIQISKSAADWESKIPDPNLSLKHTMFLIGDAGGAPLNKSTTALTLMDAHMKKATGEKSVIFLGDNIYPVGMPPAGEEKERKLAEHRLNAQLKLLEGFDGTPIFIPGNHDWTKYGLKGIRRQEKYIEKKVNEGIADEEDWKNVFYPDNGCSGPEVIEINDQLVIIVVDSQWYLRDWDKDQEMNDGCESKSREQFVWAFETVMRKNRNKNVVVAMHHPLFTNGPHGGNFPLKDHLFPLTALNKKLYIPLPGIGTLYTTLRSTVGSSQDMSNHLYRDMSKHMMFGATKNGNFMFVAGHEHTLQYLENENQNFVVSGSGSKSNKTKLGKGADFVVGQQGFSKMKFYEDGSAWIEFWMPNESSALGELVFRKKVKEKLSISEENIPASFPEYEAQKDSVTTHVITTEVAKKGLLHKTILGKHYRDLYRNEFTFPTLDLATFKGGLTAVKRGGGAQTNSLRLRADNGHEYVMRAMTKDASRLLPFPFNKMYASGYVAEDSFLSTHPFAPIAVPPLAKAANIYHTNPTLYYVPKQPILDVHNDMFGGEIYLVEERPSRNWSEFEHFGKSEKIISTPDLCSKLVKNHNHKVDQPWALRARLLDILIGDWDRHDDQWRWARVGEEDGRKIYRPIPRDRDQAFSKYDGALLKMASIMPFLKQLKVYSEIDKNMKWSTWSSKNYDRSFLNELTWEDWEKEIQYLKSNVTDEVIDEAFATWPKIAYEMSAEEIKINLKKRRENLDEMAKGFYAIANKNVDVYGSEKRERFEITRLNNEEVSVKVFGISKKKDPVLLYERTFQKSVTKEIHIYGLGGKDEFVVSGEVNKSILLRLIGGLGRDHFIDQSKVSGLGKKTIVYDSPDINTLELGSEGKDKTSKQRSLNIYDRRHIHYEHDFFMPLPLIGGNADDGFMIGALGWYTHYGFKKSPYASKHLFKTSYAFGSESVEIDYSGEFVHTFGAWDFLLDARYHAPRNSINFFGLGNESAYNEDLEIDFYRTRKGMLFLNPRIGKRFAANAGLFSFGPTFERHRVAKTDNRFIDSYGADIPNFFKGKMFAGGAVKFDFVNTNDLIAPTRGVTLNSGFEYKVNVENSAQAFHVAHTSLSIYQNLDRAEKLIFATKIGAAWAGEKGEYYNLVTLGGNQNNRGLRANRYSGNRTFYQNIDLRYKLISSYNPILPMTLGLIGGFDYGRVWLPDEASQKWHASYGGGIYLSPVNAIILSFQYFIPRNENGLFSFRTGFSF